MTHTDTFGALRIDTFKIAHEMRGDECDTLAVVAAANLIGAKIWKCYGFLLFFNCLSDIGLSCY